MYFIPISLFSASISVSLQGSRPPCFPVCRAGAGRTAGGLHTLKRTELLIFNPRGVVEWLREMSKPASQGVCMQGATLL